MLQHLSGNSDDDIPFFFFLNYCLLENVDFKFSVGMKETFSEHHISL